MSTTVKYIKNFFTVPTFEGDENKTLIARILHVILMIVLGTIIIAFFMAASGKVTNQTF